MCYYLLYFVSDMFGFIVWLCCLVVQSGSALVWWVVGCFLGFGL